MSSFSAWQAHRMANQSVFILPQQANFSATIPHKRKLLPDHGHSLSNKRPRLAEETVKPNAAPSLITYEIDWSKPLKRAIVTQWTKTPGLYESAVKQDLNAFLTIPVVRKGTFLFLDLPGEIRNAIYRAAFVRGNGAIIGPEKGAKYFRNHYAGLNLNHRIKHFIKSGFRTSCKQIYQEVNTIFFGENVIKFDTARSFGVFSQIFSSVLLNNVAHLEISPYGEEIYQKTFDVLRFCKSLQTLKIYVNAEFQLTSFPNFGGERPMLVRNAYELFITHAEKTPLYEEIKAEKGQRWSLNNSIANASQAHLRGAIRFTQALRKKQQKEYKKAARGATSYNQLLLKDAIFTNVIHETDYYDDKWKKF